MRVFAAEPTNSGGAKGPYVKEEKRRKKNCSLGGGGGGGKKGWAIGVGGNMVNWGKSGNKSHFQGFLVCGTGTSREEISKKELAQEKIGKENSTGRNMGSSIIRLLLRKGMS